jgi:hypothetical protein
VYVGKCVDIMYTLTCIVNQNACMLHTHTREHTHTHTHTHKMSNMRVYRIAKPLDILALRKRHFRRIDLLHSARLHAIH